jgi:hypothetical protein
MKIAIPVAGVGVGTLLFFIESNYLANRKKVIYKGILNEREVFPGEPGRIILVDFKGGDKP